MKQEKYIAPEYGGSAFHCPLCGVFANQLWSRKVQCYLGARANSSQLDNIAASLCVHCKEYSFWIDQKLIHPRESTAPLAHKDMPESVLEYYNEAREVSTFSQRSAAALLRIAAKKLCEELGEDSPNLNQAIGNLGKKGLPENLIKSLDIVRIVGNEGGAHEGQIDLSGEDNKFIVDKLFWLVNFIVEKVIFEPNNIDQMYLSLPEDKKKGAEIRNAKEK